MVVFQFTVCYRCCKIIYVNVNESQDFSTCYDPTTTEIRPRLRCPQSMLMLKAKSCHYTRQIHEQSQTSGPLKIKVKQLLLVAASTPA